MDTKILMVDDNHEYHSIIKGILQKEIENLEFKVVNSIESFLKNLQGNRFDLVISEITIHGYNILEDIGSFKQNHPDLPVIIFTDKGCEEIAVQAMKYRVDDYIVKSFNRIEVLLQVIRNLLMVRLKRVEGHLLLNENKYRRLLESMMDGYAFVNMEGKIVECNMAFLQMMNYSLKELLVLKYTDITPPKWHQMEDDIIKYQVLTKGYSDIYVKEYLKKDGTVFPVEIRTFLFRNDNGENEGMWTIIRDITQYKQFEKLLIRSEENFRELFEYSPIGKSITTINGSVFVNNAFCEILGYSKAELCSMCWNDIVYKEDISQSDKFFQSLLNNETKVIHYETKLLHKQGKIIYADILTHLRRDSEGMPKFYVTTITDITTKKKAERDLVLSEYRFRSYFDLSIAGFAITSPDMKWIEVNSYLCQMLGYPKDELTKMTWKELTHPDDINIDLALFSQLMKGEIDGYTIDKRFLHKDDKTIWTSMSVKSLKDINGNIDCILAILVDITALKQINVELLQKTSELEMILKNMHNAFVMYESVFDIEGNYVSYRFAYFNDAFEKYTKLKLEDVKGKEVFEVWPETEQSWVDVYKIVATTGIPKTFDMYHSPTKAWYHCSAYRPSESSKMICIIFENITASKVIEDKLAWEQYLMEALLNNIPDYIYFKDLESRFLRINKALSQVFGLNDTLAAIGKSDVDFFEKEHSLETYHDEQTIIKTGIPIIGKEEIQVWSERPTLWVSTTKMPLKDSAGKIIGTFGVSRDITEIKKFQDELLKAKEKAEESDVLKTAFIQNISHEIRTPLNAITGFASFLVKPDLPTEKKMEFIRIINLSCDQLISVITGIISLSTLDAGQEKIIEKKTTLNALLKDIYNQFIINHECEKVTLSYHSDVSDELSTVIIDSVKLTQILINLVGNALKFTSEGSVKFGFTLSENIIEFFVSDTGIGIPKEMHNLIFERFRQVDNSSTRRYGGNGIGLTISKGYVEMMGGTINVTSNPGSGSLFSFRLPYRPVYN